MELSLVAAPALWAPWGEIASSGSRRLRNTLQLLHAPPVYANHCNYSPFGCAYFQQVLFEFKAPHDPEYTDYSSYWAELQIIIFFFALRLVLILQESSQTAFKWNMGGRGASFHTFYSSEYSGLVHIWKSVLA